MTFQIHALDPAAFADLFDLPDAALAARNIHRSIVTANPGTPCRVSLADAQIGDTVLLLNYLHQPAETPYKASHAIFVRRGVAQSFPAPGDIPEVLRSRLVSLRLFDTDDMMIDADVTPGTALAAALHTAFADKAVAYTHLHYAKPGCYAALARRV